MARITEECVARIKDTADIVAVVGRYVQLRRAGVSWKACCPFHNEKTPSFHVNPARQSFHCFGCGVGGDAVKFIMMYENLDYPTALRRLADMNGVPVIEEEENPELARQRWLRSRIIELNTLAAEYYTRQLCRNKAADHVREYLKGRSINIDIARRWGLGWAPPDFRALDELARSKGVDARLLADAYLLGRGRSGLYPVFRDRLMFPIHNLRGEVVGFSGRVVHPEDKDPRKYVNTAETAAFRKGELLFGLFKATGPIGKAGMTVVICEGQLDVIACHELADVRNAVAGLGTAFTEDHARTLAKYARKAILCYDGDAAGMKASEKTYRILTRSGLVVHQAALPPGEDPDSLIRSRGAAALQEAIAQARPYLELRAETEIATHGREPDALATMVPKLADLAAEIPNDTLRDMAVAGLASRLAVGLSTLRDMVSLNLSERKKQPTARRPHAPTEQQMTEPEPTTPIRMHPAVRDLISLAHSSPEAQEELLQRMDELQEPIRHLSGGIMLQRVMEALPTPGDPAAWEQFVNSLPPEQALALRQQEGPPLPASALNDTCAAAAGAALMAKMDELHARLRDPSLSRAEYMQHLEKLSTLKGLLNERSTND